MPGSGQKHYGCFNCPNRVRQKDRHIISSRNRAFIAKLTGRTPSNSDFLCNKCRCLFQHHIKKKTSIPAGYSRFQHNPLKLLHSVIHPFLSHFPAHLEDMLHAACASAKVQSWL